VVLEKMILVLFDVYLNSKGTKFVCGQMDVTVMQSSRSGSDILDLIDYCAIHPLHSIQIAI